MPQVPCDTRGLHSNREGYFLAFVFAERQQDCPLQQESPLQQFFDAARVLPARANVRTIPTRAEWILFIAVLLFEMTLLVVRHHGWRARHAPQSIASGVDLRSGERGCGYTGRCPAAAKPQWRERKTPADQNPTVERLPERPRQTLRVRERLVCLRRGHRGKAQE